MSKWIRFEYLYSKPKTEVWAVVSKSSHEILGQIRWYPCWRQYVFFPEADTLYSNGCMEVILNFITRLMSEHKQKKIGV